jgi:hypothetical protein
MPKKKPDNKLAGIKKKLDDARKEMKKAGEKAFKEAVVDVFERYPMINAFQWNQYTPYFNDGSPCTFNVHDPKCSVRDTSGLVIKGESGEDAWYGDYEDDIPADMISKETYKQLNAALNEMADYTVGMTELMESMFGDHITVTCTREDITTEEYNHD